MAGFAGVVGCNVCAGLARRVHTVMTLAASASDARVIKSSANPRCGRVAGIAFNRCRDMRRRLSARRRSVVAT